MMTALLLAAAFALVLLAVAAGVASRRAARGSGLPRGRMLYSDTGFAVGKVAPTVAGEDGERQERPLLSRRHGLVGRPDYVVRTAEGIVPVEVKSSRCPPGGEPYDSHVMQVAAYCLLAEDVLGERVPHGLIRYRDCDLKVEYTEELRGELLALLEEMREARRAEEVHRSHDEPRRCAGCSMREQCDESLAG